MRTRILFLRTLAILVLFVSACAAWAQTGIGIYPFGAYDSLGTDTINIGNLNVHLSFPVINKPGRGLPFYYNLNYDGLVWTPITVNGTEVWSLAPNAGWRGETETTTGYLSYVQSQSTVRNSGGVCITATERFFVYHDPFGVAHSFPGVQDTIKTGTGSCTGGSETATGVAADSSGYAINIAAAGGMQVIAKDGHVFVPPQNATTGQGSVTDSNGNEVSTDGQGNFTDTLGMVALAVTGSSSSAQTFTYKDTLGNAQNVVVNYGPYTVQTAFGCSGIGEFGPEVTQLVSSIEFPDKSTYIFNYEQTPGVAANVTGRLLSITLPTGGKISYGYSGSNNGISCADGSAMGLTRTLTNDPAGSTRSYTRTVGTTTSSTAVVDGLHNALNYSFVATGNGPYETQRQEYNGASTGTAVLSRVSCYNGASPSTCVTTVPSSTVSQLDTYETADGLKQRGSTITYDNYGDVTGETDYDYGTSTTRGSVLRSETISGYRTQGIVSNYTSDIVKDGNGNVVSSLLRGYDTTTLTATNGVPQHVSVSSQRGNLTNWEYFINNSNNRAAGAAYYYDDTGQVLSSLDANGNATSYAYDSSYDAYLVGITWPAVNGVTQSEQITPDFNTGLPMTATLNGNKTSYVYDSMLRETRVTAPDGGATTWTYNSTGSVSGDSPATESVSVLHAGSTSITVTRTLDWYGRIQTTNTTDDVANDLVTYSYDANGNIASTTNPYKNGASQYVNYATYDVLGRQLSLKEPDCQGTSCSMQTWSPLGNTDTITDEAGHKRELFNDGLGRISEALEPDTSGNLTLETDYLYNQNYSTSNGTAPSTYQTIINQKGGSTNSALWRTRTFAYDLVGRIVSVKTPEAGLISYTYNQGSSLCTGNPSQACSQTDARGVVTTYTYDALNRLAGKSYTTTGTTSAATPSVSYTYDQSSFNGLTITNGPGNLTGMTDGTGSTAWSYDKLGRPVATRKTLNGVTLQSNVTYNLDGTVNTLQDFGGTTLTYTYTGAGLQKGVTDQTGRSYASAGTYNAAGQLTGLTLPLTSGSLQQTLGYNSRMQPQTIQATVGGSLVQNLTIGYGTVGQNNGNISTITNGMDATHGRDQAYQYDYLNRVTQGGDNTHWGEQYGYDNWGNLIQKTQTLGSGYGFSVASPANNQLPQMSYDAAGDVTRDQLGTAITYDANGRIVTAGSGTYSYDGSDYRVTKTSGGVTTLYWPNPVAGAVDESNATGTSFGRQVFVGGVRVWSEDTAGNGRYLLQDQLGSTRMTVNMAGAVLDDLDYRSYGDVVANYGTNPSDNHYVFTGYESDSADSSTDYAQYRNLSSYMGRFTRPDPYMGSYDFTNPQSLNRYNYALNNPLINVDPSGLECVWDDGSYDAADDPNTGSPDQCEALGGTYEDPSEFENALLTNGQYANIQYGSWSGTGDSVIQSSWIDTTPTVTANWDTTVTIQVPSAAWDYAAIQTTPVSGFWQYGNYAGAGGMGAPVNNVDAGAMVHDYCYSKSSLSLWQNFGPPNAALQACNQQLCDTEKVFAGNGEQNMSWQTTPNSGGMDERQAAQDIVDYFTLVPRKGNACHK